MLLDRTVAKIEVAAPNYVLGMHLIFEYHLYSASQPKTGKCIMLHSLKKNEIRIF